MSDMTSQSQSECRDDGLNEDGNGNTVAAVSGCATTLVQQDGTSYSAKHTRQCYDDNVRVMTTGPGACDDDVGVDTCAAAVQQNKSKLMLFALRLKRLLLV